MARCMVCNKQVSTAFVVCGHCAEEITSGAIPEAAVFYIGRLANEIANDTSVYPCALCNNDCHGQEDAHICPEGVKGWLMDRAKEYFGGEKVHD